jgi:hypothetical protein
MQKSQVHILLLIFQVVCLAIYVLILVGQSRKVRWRGGSAWRGGSEWDFLLWGSSPKCSAGKLLGHMVYRNTGRMCRAKRFSVTLREIVSSHSSTIRKYRSPILAAILNPTCSNCRTFGLKDGQDGS